MSYEFSTGTEGLNYPNPYRIENKFLLAKTIIYAITFLFLIFFIKFDLDKQNWIGLIINVIGALSFLYFSATNIYQFSQQLKVYFGRGQPSSLADNLEEKNGISKSALELKEMIRQGALNVKVPNGNINGFLYSMFDTLIISPYEIQALFQNTFTNLVKILTVSLFFIIAIIFNSGKDDSWLGLYFLIFTFYLILQPIFSKKHQINPLNIIQIFTIFVFSLIIPIALIIGQQYFFDISAYSFGSKAFFLLGITLFGEAFMFLALIKQLYRPSGITTEFIQDTVTFNAQPQQISEELERQLQSQWVLNIPNRVYGRIQPQIFSTDVGEFKGLIIQETQPMVASNIHEEESIKNTSKNIKTQWILSLNFLSIICVVLFSVGVLFTLFHFQKNPQQNYSSLSWISFFAGIYFLSIYWFKNAHALWGRFDFESKLYVIEFQGSFIQGKVKHGNQWKDTIQSEKNIFTIENMTIRVWVTHLLSSVFNHGLQGYNNETLNNPRSIIQMISLKEEANAIINHIKTFSTKQSLFINPTSNEDIKNAEKLNLMNNINKNNTLNENQKINYTHDNRVSTANNQNGINPEDIS